MGAASRAAQHITLAQIAAHARVSPAPPRLEQLVQLRHGSWDDLEGGTRGKKARALLMCMWVY